MALELTPEQAARWDAHRRGHSIRVSVHQCAIPSEEMVEIKDALKNGVGISKIGKKTGRNGATISPIYTAMVHAGELL